MDSDLAPDERLARRQRKLTAADASNPLDFAIALRDEDILDTVEAALCAQRVALAFQPIIQSGTRGQIAFYEGLIRVLEENGRIIPARDFITKTEGTALGARLDVAALHLGLQALSETPDLRLAINMSSRSVFNPVWLQTLEAGLDQDPTAGERLILEITESSAIEHPDQVAAFMTRMQRRGVCFALDDFGAGYTSFRYLRRFYFDILKIDGQFISGIEHDTDNQVLMSALLSIADHFEMLTVAECVETAEEADYLSRIGVDCQQGYHFGAPSVAAPWHAGASGVQRA